jgi:hypothetical protein
MRGMEWFMNPYLKRRNSRSKLGHHPCQFSKEKIFQNSGDFLFLKIGIDGIQFLENEPHWEVNVCHNILSLPHYCKLGQEL